MMLHLWCSDVFGYAEYDAMFAKNISEATSLGEADFISEASSYTEGVLHSIYRLSLFTPINEALTLSI